MIDVLGKFPPLATARRLKLHSSKPPAPSSGGLIDLFGDGHDIRQTARAAAERLFQKEKELFYQICLELGLDEAQKIFAARPEIALSDQQREKLKKQLISDMHHLNLRYEPEYRNLSKHAKAGDLLSWYNRLNAGRGTPEHRELVALLAVIVRESDTLKNKRAVGGKGRYARITLEGFRKQLTRLNSKRTSVDPI
jgi:hypothetical protein